MPEINKLLNRVKHDILEKHVLVRIMSSDYLKASFAPGRLNCLKCVKSPFSEFCMKYNNTIIKHKRKQLSPNAYDINYSNNTLSAFLKATKMVFGK